MRVKSDDPAHVLPGYDYDVVNEDALLHRMLFNGFDLRTPEGLHYRALALPASHRISYTALIWIRRFVKQGGLVIGTEPTGTLGLIPPEEEADYKRIADEMWAGCAGGAVTARYGQGTIYCSSDAGDALMAMGVAPDFSYRLETTDGDEPGTPSFDYVHRRTANAEIYFVRNTRPTELKATLSFRVHGREPELWNVDDAAKVPALVYKETDEGRIEIPLAFPAKGSVFVIFERSAQRHLVEIEKERSIVFPSIDQGTGVFSSGDRGFVATDPGTYRTTDSQGSKQTFTVSSREHQAPFNTSWTLSFPAGWGAPSSVPVDRFQSWTESKDPGIRYFSGTAVYRTNLQIPAGFVAPGRQLWLQLGQVREIATVTVNGRTADTVWRRPSGVRIDPLVHAGNNIVEIKVTNLWPNRIIGDLQPSATEHYTHTNIRAYTQDSPLMPSGLLEPVTVQIDYVQRLQ